MKIKTNNSVFFFYKHHLLQLLLNYLVERWWAHHNRDSNQKLTPPDIKMLVAVDFCVCLRTRHNPMREMKKYISLRLIKGWG